LFHEAQLNVFHVVAPKIHFPNQLLTLHAALPYTTYGMNQIAKLLRRKLVVGLSSSIFLIVAAGATFTLHTAHAYVGTCSQLSGFPGLLQKMGVFASGTCASKPGGTICGGGSSCTVSGNPGTCKNTGAPGNTPVCTCVPNSSSIPGVK
jgi:hypothetical protein